MMLNHLNISFIGGGNMASAMIGGLIKNGADSEKISVADPYGPSREKLTQEFKVQTFSSITAMAESLQQSQVIVLAVKPQQFKEACDELAPYLKSSPDAVCLSVAAGINTVDIVRWLNHAKIVRAMPNTPALIAQGMTGLFATSAALESDRLIAQTICNAVGKTIWVDQEHLMNAVTALSGSGPAYVFAFLEALENAANELGIDNATGRTLAIQTVLGAANLAALSNDSPATLREKVTSKGGTTFAALEVLRQENWSKIISKALAAANARGAEMGEEFGKN